jgi:ABC-type amino acid transport substrate-binding protein
MKFKAFVFAASLLIIPYTYASDTIKIAGEEFVPYKYVDDDGKVKGIDADIARYLLDKLGVKYEIKIAPWERTWNALVTGDADIGLAVSNKLDRAQYVYFTQNSVWTTHFVFFTNEQTKEKYDIQSFDDVKKYNLKIGIINGNSYSENFWEAFPAPDREKQKYHPLVEGASTLELNLRKVSANRIQLTPISVTSGWFTMKRFNIPNVTYYDWVMFSKPYPTAFSKKSTFKNARFHNIEELMVAYDNALGELKKDRTAFRAFFDKYGVDTKQLLPNLPNDEDATPTNTPDKL